MADENYHDFIIRVYEDVFKREYLITNFNSQSELMQARLLAQRKAIDEALVSALVKFSPTVSEKEIWEQISTVHKLKVANLSEFGISCSDQEAVMKRCLSAHQSWIKTSGHSFERYISNIVNDKLKDNEIQFILQSELTRMIKDKLLSNTEEDIAGLRAWGKDFDLYAIQTVHGETHVFGCIQSKTSIRDRVGRDVNFSNNAMDGLFWSVAVTLDGSFLKMPEFIHMVNGGASYKHNGWHGMYAMSGINASNNRIYKVNDTLDLFVDHAIEAAKQFIKDRRKLDHSWRP